MESGPHLAIALTSEQILWTARTHGILSLSFEVAYQARLAFDTPAAGRPGLIHGPRIGIRPLVLSVWSPRLLSIGQRFGSLAFVELFFAYWTSSAGRSGSLGFAFTWDSPLPH
jgi:hypothetical protein